MLEELRALYQDVILDHGKNPRNFRHPEGATCSARGHNPMCGDTLTVYLTVGGDGRIEDVAFEGRGCAISVASASLMTELLKGKTAEEAEGLFDALRDLCTGGDFNVEDAAHVDPDAIERLQVLSGVREFPIRVKCATLAWHTMKAAMAGDNHASTE